LGKIRSDWRRKQPKTCVWVSVAGGKGILQRSQTFSQAVMCIQEMLDDTQVVIDVEKGHIHFGTVCVENLTPREFSVYLTMAQLCIDGRKIKQEEEEEFACLVWANYKNRRKKSDEITLEKWLEDDGVKLGSFFWARFGEDRSNIAKKFRKVMGEYGKQFNPCGGKT
jgi:CRISPR-associated protein, NE0113 family